MLLSGFNNAREGIWVVAVSFSRRVLTGKLTVMPLASIQVSYKFGFFPLSEV